MFFILSERVTYDGACNEKSEKKVYINVGHTWILFRHNLKKKKRNKKKILFFFNEWMFFFHAYILIFN